LTGKVEEGGGGGPGVCRKGSHREWGKKWGSRPVSARGKDSMDNLKDGGGLGRRGIEAVIGGKEHVKTRNALTLKKKQDQEITINPQRTKRERGGHFREPCISKGGA